MDEKRIAFLLGPGFEDSEFQIPFDRLKTAEFDIDVIGANERETLHGYRRQTPVETTHSIEDVHPDDYVALVIPGGQSPDRLRADSRFVDFVKAFNALGRPLAAICHGPQLLMAAHLVRGRTLTAWPTIQADLKMIDGVTVRNEPVVVDDNWITSRKPDDLEVFSATILEEIQDFVERGAPAATVRFSAEEQARLQAQPFVEHP